MSLGSRINEIRKSKGLSIDDLCERSGIPKGTLSKITAGITTSPTLDTVRAIANALECRLDDLDDTSKRADFLSMDEQNHIKKYRSLTPDWKEAVDGVLTVGYRTCTEQATPAREPAEIIYFKVPGYALPMSAGLGEPAGQEPPEDFSLKKAPPQGTSYIARVHGHSMEPSYHDGELVFVHAVEEIPKGQIGVFFMDGQQWVKELGDGELISHNPGYDPRPMTEDVRCQGLVLGVCDDSYFE